MSEKLTIVVYIEGAVYIRVLSACTRAILNARVAILYNMAGMSKRPIITILLQIKNATIL